MRNGWNMGVTEIYTAREDEEEEEKTLQHERKYVGEHLNISYSANKRNNNNNKKKERKNIHETYSQSSMQKSHCNESILN